MRREITIGLVLMLVLSSLTIISGNVSAEIKKEDMTWSIGDKWEYRYTMTSANTTTILKMTVEVTGESAVEIDGINYDVFVAEITGKIEAINSPKTENYNFSLVEGSTVDGTLYVAKENDETTKTVQNIKYQLSEGITDTLLNQTSTVVTFSVLTSGGKPDVIDAGTTWSSTIRSETTTTMTFSGSYFDTYMPGYTNPTTTTDNKTETSNFECTGKKNITTTAGTFETYEVEVSQEQGYTLQYISPIAKEDVKDIAYDNYGNIVSLMELISYDIPSSSSTTPKTPGFELAIVLCSIAIILLWKRKRAN
jgi:hypothetical protein